MKHVYRFSSLLLLGILTASLALGGSTGKISGRVTDARTKDGIPGVNVVVTSTTLGAVTNVEGRYVILNVPPGVYSLTASLIGYKKAQINEVRVSVDFTTPLNIGLEEGSVELDAVVVQGERTPLVRKDLTNPVASISTEAIRELPVTEISQVVGLQAGITVDNDGSIHVRGGEGNEIAYTLNGININNPYGNARSVGVATNAVQEVSVSSGTFNAEYGSALSGVVNYVTKDGGSKWSGSLKQYFGDHLSSHNDLFNNIDRINAVNVNRTEASIGGPIIGDALSFFASGVYNWNGGYLYGQRLYLPTDSYVFRNEFPTGDPRRSANNDPLYFNPLGNDTSTAKGLPSGDGSIVPMNWSRSFNLQGNLSYKIMPEVKLKYEFVYDFDERPRNDGNSTYFDTQFKPDGRATTRDQGYFHSIELTHSFSKNAFYTLKGSYVTDISKYRAFQNITDPGYLPSFFLQDLPTTTFLAGGVDLDRFYRKTQTYGGKFDLVAQILDNHEVKFGVEVRSHKLELESYTLQFYQIVNGARDSSVTVANALAGHKAFPYIPGVNGGFTAYTHKPLQAATYIQDKIELFSSIILNLGLRYEFFKPDALYNPSISQELELEQGKLFVTDSLRRAETKHMLAPRFSVSYPITDQGTIRFSYGHFYQIGSLSTLYRNPNFRAPRGTPSFGNANVEPQRSIQYELGLQQALTDNLKIEVTAYYKDVRDYIFSQRVITPSGNTQYNLLTNLSYANTRGVSISLLKRRSPSDILSASVDYTFQVADGNRTEPTDEIFYNEQQGKLAETYLVPFSFDRSHTITSTVTLSQPNDWAISMIGYFRTGTPYTPEFPSSVVPITFTQNSDRRPIQWNIDLKAEKFFSFAGFDYSIFVQVDNLFDVKNENTVWANSGRALYNIEQTVNPSQFSDIRRRIGLGPEKGHVGLPSINAIDNYYSRPGNISAPRLVRVGASILF